MNNKKRKRFSGVYREMGIIDERDDEIINELKKIKDIRSVSIYEDGKRERICTIKNSNNFGVIIKMENLVERRDFCVLIIKSLVPLIKPGDDCDLKNDNFKCYYWKKKKSLLINQDFARKKYININVLLAILNLDHCEWNSIIEKQFYIVNGKKKTDKDIKEGITKRKSCCLIHSKINER